jgi:hypothetical protein
VLVHEVNDCNKLQANIGFEFVTSHEDRTCCYAAGAAVSRHKLIHEAQSAV